MSNIKGATDVRDLVGASYETGAAIVANATTRILLSKEQLSHAEGQLVESLLSPRRDVLVGLKFPTPSGNLNVHLTEDRPVGLLVGVSGSGKSVAAMVLARRHLEESAGEVVLVTCYAPAVDHETDMAAKIWQNCADEHPDRTHLALIKGFRGVAKYNFPKGSLVIVDEFRSRTEGLADLVNRVKECGAVVVILVQTFTDLVDVQSMLVPNVSFFAKSDSGRGKFWVVQSDASLGIVDFTEAPYRS
ncbi:TPA: AAA family ATPase [Pseudomonas aeruginosa]|nr:AAA family ATPase [Pseudomonas aeruginosa]